MKISYNWLQNYLNINLPAEKLADLLTDIGLEVEGIEEIESIQGGLKGVVIGKVLTKVQHPNADRLSVTTVDIGSDKPIQIVCGASNVEASRKVPVATVGTWLYDGDNKFKIKRGKIRGQESEGMICAEYELGLGQDNDGIMILAICYPYSCHWQPGTTKQNAIIKFHCCGCLSKNVPHHGRSSEGFLEDNYNCENIHTAL